MNIFAKKGDKVTFLNRNGYKHEPKDAVDVGLVEGETYTVDIVVVGGWMSRVELQEFTNRDFNTVMFEDVIQT